LLKHEPSAQIPWQKTIVGFVCADMFDFLLLAKNQLCECAPSAHLLNPHCAVELIHFKMCE